MTLHDWLLLRDDHSFSRFSSFDTTGFLAHFCFWCVELRPFIGLGKPPLELSPKAGAPPTLQLRPHPSKASLETPCLTSLVIFIASDRDSAQEGRGMPLVQSRHRRRLSHDTPANEG